VPALGDTSELAGLPASMEVVPVADLDQALAAAFPLKLVAEGR